MKNRKGPRVVLGCVAAALAAPATAYEAGDWLLRASLASTLTNSGGDETSAPVADAEAVFSEHTRPALGLSYLVLDSLGVGVTVMWPFGQNLYLEQEGGSQRVASLRTMPVSLGVEYYLPRVNRGNFYLLAGWQYTRANSATYVAGSLPGVSDIRADDAHGVMAGLGLDWDTDGKWSFNASVVATRAPTTLVFEGPSGVVDKFEADPEPLIWHLGLSREL